MTPTLHISAIEFKAALPLWLIAAFAMAAIGSAVYFYCGQKTVAGTGRLRVLTLLRLSALLIAVVMLVAPSHVGTFLHRSRGRLYLVLDDTRSMARVDVPQARSRADLAEDALRQLRPT